MAHNLRVQNELNKARSTAKAKPAPKSPARRTSVAALLLMALALLVFLALVSYDPADEANADVRFTDLYKVFTGDPIIKAKADTAHNLLGLIGSMLSEFLIKSTVGYSILALPFLLMVYGWAILRRKPLRRVFTITNYTIVYAVLIATAFGMVRMLSQGDLIGMEWSGVVGDVLSLVLSQLLGKTGGTLLLLTSLAAVTVLAAHLDLHALADRMREVFGRSLRWVKNVVQGGVERVRAWKRDHRKPEEEEDEGDTAESSRIRIAAVSDEESFATRDADDEQSMIGAQREAPSKLADDAGKEPNTMVIHGDVKLAIEKKTAEPEVNFDERKVDANEVEDIDYVFPSVELLDPPRPSAEKIDEEELRANADLLRATLAEFDVQIDNITVTTGPVVTLYELVPSSGVKISRIVSLENDIALKLAAKGIRIIAPIPGKSAVGVEIPNNKPSLVSIRSVINSSKFRDTDAKLPLALGKTIAGEVFTDDLTKMPHLLIAGSTGSGKSVGINTILASLLFRMHPSDLKVVIFDPKKIELTAYTKLKHHFLAVCPDIKEDIITNPKNAVIALKSVELEMERRYDKLAAAGVRNIADYNEKLKAGKLKNTETITHQRIPYLIVVIDELADLMMTAAGEVEEPIARLAQLARAVGIHLVVATQRPSVDVITGVIKANFPARIAYQVASRIDSRTILDMNGAEQLLGNGDMLYMPSGSPKPIRLQNAFISSDEVEALVEHIAKQQGFSKPYLLPSPEEKKRNGDGGGTGERDELFEEAARIIVRHQQGSVSLLQRRLKVGYSRAARLVDELEAAGIVGPFDGSKAREVLVESEADLEAYL
ncbi:MAG: cell division protein FtsK [Ignavibacteria bacterium]